MSAVKDLCIAAPGENLKLKLELGAGFEGSCGFALVLAPSQMREHGLGLFGRADLRLRRNPLDRKGRFAPQPGSAGQLPRAAVQSLRFKVQSPKLGADEWRGAWQRKARKSSNKAGRAVSWEQRRRREHGQEAIGVRPPAQSNRMKSSNPMSVCRRMARKVPRSSSRCAGTMVCANS